MKLRIHAQLDESNINSVQDAHYMVGQILGIKIMRKFMDEYEMEYGMDMVIYRNKYGSVIISVSSDGVSTTIVANGKRESATYEKDAALDTIVENVFQLWQSMLSATQVA